MANDNALTCPIKLPPLDGSRFLPGPQPAKTAAVQQNTGSRAQQAENPASFNKILREISSSQLKKTAQSQTSKDEDVGMQFEAFLLSLVFKQAFNTQITSASFGDSYATRMYLDMFIDAAAEEAAKSSSLGIGELIAEDINKYRTEL